MTEENETTGRAERPLYPNYTPLNLPQLSNNVTGMKNGDISLLYDECPGGKIESSELDEL